MKIIFIDCQKCLACRSCELACAVEHSQTKVLEQAINETPLPEKRIFVEEIPINITTNYVPTSMSSLRRCTVCKSLSDESIEIQVG